MLQISFRVVHSRGEPPTLHEQHGDTGVRTIGIPDDAVAEIEAWLDERADSELSDIELDYLSAKNEADREGAGVYLIVKTDDDYKLVAAASEASAYRKAIANGWPGDDYQGTISVEEVTPPPPFADFELEVLETKGWVKLGPWRARSAAQAVAMARLCHPDWNIRAASLLSVQAQRRIDRTRRAA